MIGAVVLAAGLSRRMGRFKLLLPWHGRTVIESVVRTVEAATTGEIVVVSGYRGDDVAAALQGTRARVVLNHDYATGEMLSSVQTGLQALGAATDAALLCLGDQPQIEADTIRRVLEAGAEDGLRRVVIPSYAMRAGHPILLPQGIWPAVMQAAGTLNEALDPYRADFRYVVVDAPGILADLDTPADYEQAMVESDGEHLR
jgi:molybdenum cofactor cytidylyltransferase